MSRATTPAPPEQTEVVVIGAGLAGLCCGLRLAERGIAFTLLEAAHRVGGRVVTDVVDGYRIDRGFQVLLDSYPEVRARLDLPALGVRAFEAGALVRKDGRFWRIGDPWRRMSSALPTLRAPFVSFSDALRLARLRGQALRDGASPSGSAASFLAKEGFSPAFRESFFQPFFGGGVTLDPDLGVDASWLVRLFGYFARGSAVLPAEGMQAIPEQLASKLPEGHLFLDTPVRAVEDGGEEREVTLESGARIQCRQVVLATDASACARLLGRPSEPAWNGTVTLSYGADRSPVGEAILVLNGEGAADGPVNHVAVLSDAQPTYAPAGKALVSASVPGTPEDSDEALDARVRAQLTGWYGEEVAGWRLLRVDRVPHSLPRSSEAEELSGAEHVQLCGDHVATPSIQGAMESGRLAAERV